MNRPIIFIGPLGAGKTTVAQLVATKLGLPLCSVDAVRSTYYQHYGYDQGVAAQIAASEGIYGVLRYSKPFEATMVEHVVTEHRGVIDFGASNSVYDESELFARVEQAFAPYRNVILLIPSADEAESNQILRQRLTQMLTAAGKDFSEQLFELNAYFVRHPSNHQLAKRVIYTKNKTPQQLCDHIVATLD